MAKGTVARHELEAEYLFQLAREKSKESRSELADIIVDLFETPGRSLNDRERSLMYGILEGIIRDIEMSVRQTVATYLAEMPDAPRDLLVALANDQIEVAYPILTQSGLLRDADLIDVIRLRTMEHQLAIAMRHDVSEEVSDALAHSDHDTVVITLLKNRDARISERTMEYLVEQSKRVNTFQEPILQRQELKPELAKRMFLWVSAALREYVLDNFDLDEKTVDDLIENAVTQELEANKTPPEEKKAAELAGLLRGEGLVTPEMLLTALREGEVSLFVAMFCRLAELREYLVMRILFEPGGEGLAIACKGIGLGKSTFASIFSLSQRTRITSARAIKQELPRALGFFNRISKEAAIEVLLRWRRGTDYLAAIRQVREGEFSQ